MLAEVETTRKPYFCPDCGWHPCRCSPCVCGDRLVGPVGRQSCPRCHTRYPLQPTGRPPLVARYPDGSRCLFCPCGQVLYWNADPATQPPERCAGCRQRYRWPGTAQPPSLPEPKRDSWYEPRDDGRVPIAFITDLNCMMCGREMIQVRHTEPDYRPTPRHLNLRCNRCGGNAIRDETHTIFGFIGSERTALRPFGT